MDRKLKRVFVLPVLVTVLISMMSMNAVYAVENTNTNAFYTARSSYHTIGIANDRNVVYASAKATPFSVSSIELTVTGAVCGDYYENARCVGNGSCDSRYIGKLSHKADYGFGTAAYWINGEFQGMNHVLTETNSH